MERIQYKNTTIQCRQTKVLYKSTKLVHYMNKSSIITGLAAILIGTSAVAAPRQICVVPFTEDITHADMGGGRVKISSQSFDFDNITEYQFFVHG